MINLYKNLPTIDLHGEPSDIAKSIIIDFIEEAYRYQYKECIIIHGIGNGILRKVAKELLSNNKKVESFKLDNFNVGQTIVYIKSNKIKQ